MTRRRQSHISTGVFPSLEALSPKLRSEVEHKLEVDREEGESPLSLAEALRDVAEDMDLPDFPAALRREMQQILVSLGCFEPISDEEARTQCRTSLGVKMKNYPVISGTRYTWVGWGPLDVY